MAVGFTALANGLLLASLVFTEWLPSNVRWAGLATLATVWLLAWWQGRGERRRDTVNQLVGQLPEGSKPDQPVAQQDQWFQEAQQHYLRGDWVATEQLLLKLLKQDTRDIESRLMLATLWRHQGRGKEALRQLDRLERLESASKWKYEIRAEREAIADTVRQDESEPDNTANINDQEISPNETNRRLAA